MEGNSVNNKMKNSISLEYAEWKLCEWQEIGRPGYFMLPMRRKMPARIFDMREEITFLYTSRMRQSVPIHAISVPLNNLLKWHVLAKRSILSSFTVL